MPEEDKYLIIRCNNEICFSDVSKLLDCRNCDEGKLYAICYCGKENIIEGSTWKRINCECGAETLPCGIDGYRLEKRV